MTEPVIYPRSYFIRTRRGVYIEMVVLFTTTLVMVLAAYGRAVRLSGGFSVQLWTEWLVIALYLIFPLVGTTRVLHHLEDMERRSTAPEPDADMTFMFHVAAMLPVTGYLPVALLLR